MSQFAANTRHIDVWTLTRRKGAADVSPAALGGPPLLPLKLTARPPTLVACYPLIYFSALWRLRAMPMDLWEENHPDELMTPTERYGNPSARSARDWSSGSLTPAAMGAYPSGSLTNFEAGTIFGKPQLYDRRPHHELNSIGREQI
jgi:hypothetical protein